MGSMATTAFPINVSAPLKGQSRSRQRRVSPQAGRALEILGHAIEYLTDEFVQAGGSLSAQDAQVQTIQLLMATNREIYFSCPESRTFGDRFRALMRGQKA